MRAVCVNPATVAAVWPQVSLLIRSAVERGRMTDFECVERDVLSGDALLWLASQDHEIYGAAVTQLQKANGRKFCAIVACGGSNLDLWLSLIVDLETYARNEGCEAMMIFGREGWKRKLDYTVSAVVLEKELN